MTNHKWNRKDLSHCMRPSPQECKTIGRPEARRSTECVVALSYQTEDPIIEVLLKGVLDITVVVAAGSEPTNSSSRSQVGLGCPSNSCLDSGAVQCLITAHTLETLDKQFIIHSQPGEIQMWGERSLMMMECFRGEIGVHLLDLWNLNIGCLALGGRKVA